MLVINPLLNRLIKIILLTVSMTLISCGGRDSKKGGGGGNDGGRKIEPSLSCNDVATHEAIARFNSEQSNYRIKGSGFNVTCTSETNVNGKVTRVEKKGYSHIAVYPRLTLKSIEKNQNNKDYALITEVHGATDTELRNILQAINVTLKNENELPVERNEIEKPSYLRFGKGPFYYLSGTFYNDTDKDHQLILSLRPKASEATSALLDEALNRVKDQPEGLELLWGPNQLEFSRQVLPTEATAPVWSMIDAHDLILSLLQDSPTAPATLMWEHYDQAIDQIYYWNLDAQRIHHQFPRLFEYAARAWQPPNFQRTTTNQKHQGLLQKLRYIVGARPDHPLKPVNDTYDKISNVIGDSLVALEAAYQYVIVKKWTEPEFHLLVEACQLLAGTDLVRPWELAQEIAKHKEFARVEVLSFSAIAGQLSKRQMILGSTPSEVISAVEGKISLGLQQQNKDYYFRSYDQLNQAFGCSRSDCVRVVDESILRLQLPDGQWPFLLRHLRWLKGELTSNLNEAFEMALPLLKNHQVLSEATLSLYQKVYQWLKNSAYLDRSEAAQKTSRYLGTPQFEESRFEQMKSYWYWLTNTIYLGRQDALAKAEIAIIQKGIGAEALNALKDLAHWLINTMYLSKTDALSKAEIFVFEKGISAPSIQTIKDASYWMINTLYMTKSDALAEVEIWIAAPQKLSPENLQQMKTFSGWLINDFYQTKTDAFNLAKDLIIMKGLTSAKTALIRAAGYWLHNTVSESRESSLKKATAYVVKANMTEELFNQLKTVYSREANRSSRSDALAKAEKEVLNL